MSEISPSAYGENLPAEVVEALKSASSQTEVQRIIRDYAVNNSEVVFQRDAINPEVFTPVEGKQAAKVEKAITIDGKRYVVEGATETEALQRQNELLQQLMSGTEPATATSGATEEPVEQERDDENGRVVTTTPQDRAFEQSWADAVQEFLHSPAGADWPGGDKNKEILGQLLVANGLQDASDKVQALADTFEHMRLYRLLDTSVVETIQAASKQRQADDLAKSLSKVTSFEDVKRETLKSVGRDMSDYSSRNWFAGN